MGTNSAATSSAHTVPAGLIVGPVVGGLVLLVAIALLYWRHRLHRLPIIDPFLLTLRIYSRPRGQPATGDSPTTSISHLRPAMVQAGHPQPYPLPRSSDPQSQRIIPPTKLERVMVLLNSPSVAFGIGTRASSNGAVTPNAQVAGRNEASQTNPFDGAPDPDPGTLPPPSYQAQVSVS
ncbi:hypothetical protein B0H13DRAFT_2650769 [Mycena leptocephala]|nr:hypothetical protein B0H13DRAFT_2650769 [Mycena leptocephala]